MIISHFLPLARCFVGDPLKSIRFVEGPGRRMDRNPFLPLLIESRMTGEATYTRRIRL